MFQQARTRRMLEVARLRLGHVRLAAEHVFHRHNVSALLRSADACGIADVHLTGERGFLPSQGPASGAARWLRLHRHSAPQAAIEAIRAEGYALWVADFAEPPVRPEQVPIDRPVCLWFGAELMGVCPEARAAADGVVTLPMYGMAQSLNLAAAASAVLYTVTQRVRAAPGLSPLLTDAQQAELVAGWLAREAAAEDRDRVREQALAAWADRLVLDPPRA